MWSIITGSAHSLPLPGRAIFPNRHAEIAAADKALETKMADKRKAAEDLAKTLSS
jgi:hypothetical protein